MTSPPTPEKLVVPDWDGTPRPFLYDGTYEREQTVGPGPLRLRIGPAERPVALLHALAACWPGPYVPLYVLMVSRSGRPAARYQAPVGLDWAELATFLARYRRFFEGDGRHHLWVGSPDRLGTLVYDRYGTIYAYGPLEAYEDVLGRHGVRPGPVERPMAREHGFAYHHEFDAVEGQLLSEWAWLSFPLQPVDEGAS